MERVVGECTILGRNIWIIVTVWRTWSVVWREEQTEIPEEASGKREASGEPEEASGKREASGEPEEALGELEAEPVTHIYFIKMSLV